MYICAFYAFNSFQTQSSNLRYCRTPKFGRLQATLPMGRLYEETLLQVILLRCRPGQRRRPYLHFQQLE